MPSVSARRYILRKKELFFMGILEEGISYKVGGWIDENTTVRFRKE